MMMMMMIDDMRKRRRGGKDEYLFILIVSQGKIDEGTVSVCMDQRMFILDSMA